MLTDKGSCCRSKVFADALGEITHKWTRPYRPQTNGKVERFDRTLLDEWAYAQVYRTVAERVAAYPHWLHHYNHHGGHTALGGKAPSPGWLSPTSLGRTASPDLYDAPLVTLHLAPEAAQEALEQCASLFGTSAVGVPASASALG